MIIQSKFTDEIKDFITDEFQIVDNENILYAVWLNNENKGFVFTQKRFYWNIRTSIFHNGTTSEIKTPSNILRKNSNGLKIKTYALNPQIPEESTPDQNAIPIFLMMQSRIGNIRFDTGRLTQEDAQNLKQIFIEYINYGRLPQKLRKNSFQEKIRNLADEASSFIHQLKKTEDEKKDDIVSSDENREDETPAPFEPKYDRRQKEVNEREYGYQYVNPEVYTEDKGKRFTSIELFIIHSADIIATLLYVTASIFAVKPVLLAKFVSTPLNFAQRFFASIGRLFFIKDTHALKKLSELEIKSDFINILIDKKNFIFAILLLFYILVRITVITFNRESRKGQSYALTLLLVLLCFLMPIKFLIFAVLAFMAYITMQFAQGFYLPIMSYKTFFVILICTVEYYLLHLFLYPGFPEIMASLVQVLKLPASW